MSGGEYLMLDDDVVDAAVRDDLEQEISDNSGMKRCAKRAGQI